MTEKMKRQESSQKGILLYENKQQQNCYDTAILGLAKPHVLVYHFSRNPSQKSCLIPLLIVGIHREHACTVRLTQ